MAATTTFITDQALIASLNRGPVTPIFNPPTSCLSTLTHVPSGAMYFGYAGQGNYFDPACFPSSTTTAVLFAWEVYYYNPAICPSGWAQATTVTSSFGGGANWLYLSIGSSTTAALCCPSGYVYNTDNGFGGDKACKSVIAPSSTVTFPYIEPSRTSTGWNLTSANPASIYTAIGPYAIFGSGIPVWWQSSDLPAFTPANKTSTQSAVTVTQTARITHSAEPTSTPGSSGPSQGAKIGLGVGIPLLVIAIGIIAAFVYFRRTGRHRGEPVSQTDPGYEFEVNAIAHATHRPRVTRD